MREHFPKPRAATEGRPYSTFRRINSSLIHATPLAASNRRRGDRIRTQFVETSVESAKPEIQSLLNQGAGRLLARASDNRSLSRELLVPRISAAVQKYLLKDDADTPHAEISKFIDELQADDLCLIIACERGDEKAWNDLVERFTATD